MRVLYVNPGLHLGGAEHSLLLLLDGLRARGVAPTVALFGPGAFKDRLDASGIPTVTVRSHSSLRRVSRYGATRALLQVATFAGFSAASAFDLARLARQCGADLIHTNGFKAHLMGSLAARLVGVPVLWHVRDFPPPGVSGRMFIRGARTLPSLVIANSDAVASAIAPDGSARVTRIYNPVDLERFSPKSSGERVRRELKLDDRAALIGLVAHLTPWKGHALFLQIARRVADRVPGSHFIVAGGAIYETDGHQGFRDSLLASCAALGLAERVTFLGARDDIPDVLAALDILVHCPEAPEPFGRSVAEAMAVGRPVVAARCGGLPEVVDDGVTGLLVEPGDVESFVEDIVGLVDDPPRRKTYGASGRQRAEAMFSTDGHTNAVMAAYSALVPALALTA